MNRRSGERATLGAVYVEFLVAFLPFFVFFLCLWQVSILYYTKLIVDHAAFAGARSAAVVVAENPNRVDPAGGAASVNTTSDARMGLVRAAAELALAPLIVDGTIYAVNIAYPKPDQPGGDDAMQHATYPGMTPSSVSLMRVRVETLMACKIAFANAILCPPRTLLEWILNAGLGRFTLRVSSEAVFPYQGASYKYDSSDDQGGHGGNAPVAALGGFCFAAGTPVATPDGARPIEEIHPGDLVVSRDEQDGRTTTARVVRTFITPDQPVVQLRLREAEPIRVTSGHRFFTLDRGWVQAQDLEADELLATVDGRELHVGAVDPIENASTVYNFEVEITHTYFVGTGGAWVHNATNGNQGCQATPAGAPGGAGPTGAAGGGGAPPGRPGAVGGGSGDGGAPPPNWKSVPAYGHAFNTHGQGAANTNNLKGRAAGTGQAQGQWLNNPAAANLIWPNRPSTAGDSVTIAIPPGMGQIIQPDGTIVPATRAVIVASATGIRTAYPVP